MFESLGNLGDFIGGIAVVVTRVYLAREVRKNTAALRTASRQEIVSGFRAYPDRYACNLATPGGTAWWAEIGQPFYTPRRVQAVDSRLVRGDLPDITRIPIFDFDYQKPIER